MKDIFHLINPWWHNTTFPTGIDRPKYGVALNESLAHNRAILLIGTRRVGKTTLLHQLISQLLKNVAKEHVFYALMDHPQISTYGILPLVSEFRTFFSLDRRIKLYLFFDEIQYIKDWEREIKALLDTENVKVFISGSASSQLLLKSPHLTGRVEKIEVHPLDFKEFLGFRNIKIAATEHYKFEKQVDEYLKIGGYPEYVLSEDPSYFSDLITDVLYKDIVSLYNLRNPDLLKDLLLLLADRVGHQTTYTKLANILSLKTDTVKEYIFYLKNTFILDELRRAASSRSARIYGPKKFYLHDNGVFFHLLGKLSYGQAFEQTVFNFLKTHSRIGFYYEDQKEADFIIESNRDKLLYESKYILGPMYEKEIGRLVKIAMDKNIKQIVVITKQNEDKRTINGVVVESLPLWKLLISS